MRLTRFVALPLLALAAACTTTIDHLTPEEIAALGDALLGAQARDQAAHPERPLPVEVPVPVLLVPVPAK